MPLPPTFWSMPETTLQKPQVMEQQDIPTDLVPVEQALQQTVQQPISEPKPIMVAQNNNQDVGVQLDFSQQKNRIPKKVGLQSSEQRMRKIEKTTKNYSQDPEAYGERMRAVGYASDTSLPKTYKGFKFTVDRLANIIEQNPNITAEQLYKQYKNSLPSVIRILPIEKAIPALDAFKEFQNKSLNIGSEQGFNLGRMPLLHKAVESTFFTKATGQNNFGGIKVTTEQRNQLKQLYGKKLKLSDNIDLYFPEIQNGATGAKYVKTSEVLNAKNKQDAQKEAKKLYSQFGQEVLGVSYDTKKEKWVAKIKDLFVNFNTTDNAIESYKNIALRKTK
jgi:hypothetical protein